jgi:hypothetical protein
MTDAIIDDPEVQAMRASLLQMLEDQNEKIVGTKNKMLLRSEHFRSLAMKFLQPASFERWAEGQLGDQGRVRLADATWSLAWMAATEVAMRLVLEQMREDPARLTEDANPGSPDPVAP